METDNLEKSSNQAMSTSSAMRNVLARKCFQARLPIRSNVNAADKVFCISSTVWNRTANLRWMFWKPYCAERSIVGSGLRKCRIRYNTPSLRFERRHGHLRVSERIGGQLLCVHEAKLS